MTSRSRPQFSSSSHRSSTAVNTPPITNSPDNILNAWIALEVLSPQAFKDEADIVPKDEMAIANFDRHELPWEVKQVPKKDHRLYYELYLGTIPMAPAVESLLKVYSDRRAEKPTARGFNPIASVILDELGRPLDTDGSICISSFAWGVPVALKGDLQKLGDWPTAERSLAEALRNELILRDRNNSIMPITKERIQRLHRYLLEVLELRDIDTKPPHFAIRRYVWVGRNPTDNSNAPEPNIMNSFYLKDLETCRDLVKHRKVPNALSHYLGISKSSKRTDLLRDNIGLRDLLQPKSTPLARWTGKDRHPLVLLQQAAVNATGVDRLPTGILGVNGPPGTGKTTLLRDVVAARILERATIMAGFDQPASAFRPSGVSLRRKGSTITLHHLDYRLKGFEMVVASSNNKAVENVSAELPAMESIAADAPNLRYFNSISDNASDRKTWGLVAAVLGKSANRTQFKHKFWGDVENGLSTYLNHAVGLPQYASETTHHGTARVRFRKVVVSENPPNNPQEALSRWKDARARFLQAREILIRKQMQLQRFHEQSDRLLKIDTEVSVANEQLRQTELSIRKLEIDLKAIKSEAGKREAARQSGIRRVEEHNRQRPGIFARVLKKSVFLHWVNGKIELGQKQDSLDQAISAVKSRGRETVFKLNQAKSDFKTWSTKVKQLAKERIYLEAMVQGVSAGVKEYVPDADFFQRDHESRQKATAWFNRQLNMLRDDVFQEAIRLHRAFIDCAADPLRQNLSILTETFGSRTLGTPESDAMVPDLWSTFFLVVPVISTTFASVNSMFSRLQVESLGWLLVDEAGQATPQAVVGALMRTKRAVVVGDPLQVEPVVTLPDGLTKKLCEHFGVDPLRYNAPDASVQTLADTASSYCAQFPIGSGSREVGAPLLVHRRCNSPMFDIANEIAYCNLMVQAKKPSANCPILGISSWVDISSEPSNDKWSPEEGEVLLKMLWKLRNGRRQPDIYIITPFRAVSYNLQAVVKRSGLLNGWVDNVERWLEERIGTVHTVQGREAETVFFVLGASAASQNGARDWAGGQPNLLNVAVTRAKTNLYVIGDRSKWRTAGYFETLDRLIPKHQSQ